MRRSPAWLVTDVVCVLAFAAAGRRTHAGETALAGVAQTAWPFLLALAVGWLAARAWQRPAAIRTGLIVWPCAALGGMLARVGLTDRGTAPGFLIVAVLFLGATLVGWRAVDRLVGRRRAPLGLA